MTLFNIINPSDDLTFRAPDTQTAALAMFLVSNGQYGADCLDKSCEDVPIFLMGGAQSWWNARFSTSIEDTAVERASDVAAALESIVHGTPEDRAAYEAKLADIDDEDLRATFAEEWAEERRSSLNDIQARAGEIGAMLREKYVAAA